MAGLFGFYTRVPRSREWMQAHLQLLQRAMVSRADHRAHLEIHAQAAFGNTGPGLHAGTLTSYTRADGAVMMAEGEVYCIGAWTSGARPFEEAWPLVHDRWTGCADALTDVDGLYSLVRYEAQSPDGPRLSIASDRYGSRRLFVLDDGDEFVFAADFAPLAAWLGSRLQVDPQFISDTICLGAPLGDRTWARQIHLFPPASEWRVTHAGVTTTRYWDISKLPPSGADVPRDMLERVDAAWHGALAARVKGEHLGQQLSGGLDSRLILADGQQRGREWLAITYGEKDGDEVRFAEACARTACVPWLLWELPGDDWLERRVALSLENGGFLDLRNAHHAGLVQHLHGRIQFEISGFAGDVTLGATYTGLSPIEAFWKLPYWHSPASEDEGVVQERVIADIGTQDPWGWMLETKMRRLINFWPHLAVNDLEVRKPFMDYALVNLCASLPLSARHDSAIQVQLLEKYAPRLLRIPIQRTGVPPGASALRWLTARAIRQLHRVVQPAAARVGLPMRPRMRGAMDVTRWFGNPDVQSAMRDALLGSDARITTYVDRQAVANTLALGFEGHRIADEVPLNLYRVERVLRHLPHWCGSL